MRRVHSFNHGWEYFPGHIDANDKTTRFSPIIIPHSNNIFPHHSFDDADYQFISTYRKTFTLPESLNGRRVMLDFDGVLTAAIVTVNGHTFSEHRGGYVPFSYDITDYLDVVGENTLIVHVDSRERNDIPPFGHTVDYMAFGGIYRDVWLRYVHPVHIHNVHVRTEAVLTDTPSCLVDVWVKNVEDEPKTYHIHVRFDDCEQHITLAPNQVGKVTLSFDALSNIDLWALDRPTLYDMVVSLSDEHDGLDEMTVQFGFREALFKDDGFYLNGERLQLRGLNRHQNYPYIGAAAPKRLQEHDAEIIKYELGCNIVRTSHYPQSPHFIRRCDEIGLLVFEEIPGWNFIGDSGWQNLVLRDVRAMIERDWNSPSIILWGVRINESMDNHDLYTRTNILARELDSTRHTGGVRYFLGSEFLEDVYTLNDFSNDIMEPEHTPHLVTEYNGHMFPTKTYDPDKRLEEHALRHASIQAKAHTMGGVSGAIGWCAFDYNTHKEFGAGDRICHHGVMDIFRLPKYAAYFYASQQAPEQDVVLRIASNWQLGDVNEGQIEKVVVFSNCDEIEVCIGEVCQGVYKPNYKEYPGLPHPPFIITDLGVILAQPYADLRVLGYLEGKVVAEQIIASDAIPCKLRLELAHDTLLADGMDMTRLSFAVTDAFDNPLRYATCIVSFEITGDAQLLGTNPFPLVGGQGALYVKAGQSTGLVTIIGQGAGLATEQVVLNIEC